LGEAADKARYLIMLFAATAAAEDPRRRQLIADVLADFDRLLESCDSERGDAHD
jgi:hypothetical protein